MKKLKSIGLNLTEQEYRDLPDLSYSFLSALSREGPSSIGKVVEPTEPMMFGTLVDNMIDGSFDISKYHISNNIEIGEKLKYPVDLLFIHAEPIKTDIKEYKSNLKVILETSEVDYWTKKDIEWRVNKILNDKSAQAYFKEKVISKDKILISRKLLDSAILSKNILKSHDFTRQLFKESSEDLESCYQLQYKSIYAGHSLKGMLDRVIIDHKNKIISPYDLKTGSKSALEFEKSYFYWRYDLQALIYSMLIINIRDEYFPDYQIMSFRFIYIGRYENKPLVWNTTSKLLRATLKGYIRNGYKYKGLKELLKDYEWYKDNNFNVSYPEEVYLSNGELIINDENIII